VPSSVHEVVHASELAALGVVIESDEARTRITAPATDESLEPLLAERLFGKDLCMSVSSIERFASCPYKFFLEQGLRVRERKEFQLDVREQGSFQHEVLSMFHEELMRESLRWRDLTPEQASDRIGRIADVVIERFHDGLMASSEQNRFTAQNYKAGLQELIGVLVGWLATNRFDPEVVEFGFGGKNALPPWRIELDTERAVLLFGRVDRIDLFRISQDEALCVVMDYKSGLKRPDRTLMHHGVQQQLPAYLLALTRMPEVAAHFNVKKISGAGCFLLPLRAKRSAKKSRREALDQDAPTSEGYMHEGLFDVQHVSLLDSGAPTAKSGQFNFRLKNDGAPYKNSFNALESTDFESLLQRSAELICEFGRRIFGGDIAIHPYKKGAEIPCDRCDYQSVCRFDPWTQKYNVLRAPAATEAAEETGK
jgi:ATP-dependent helicase/nuclease subunit B